METVISQQNGFKYIVADKFLRQIFFKNSLLLISILLKMMVYPYMTLYQLI